MARFLLFSIALVFSFSFSSIAKNHSSFNDRKSYFIENKGQITDQGGNARNDIQYTFQSHGINVFIGGSQLHYQFLKRQTCNNEGITAGHGKTGMTSEVETYRMDVELVNANSHAIAVSSDEQAYYENYYLPGCPQNGLCAHTFKKITYKDVYPGIDWVIYLKGDKLEHEFMIGPGADASQIKLRYNGQTSLNINNDGSITATTPMGTITEHAPLCYGTEKKEQATIAGAYKLNGNVISFDINDYKGALVIDPMVEWGTYYGPDSSTSPGYDVTCDQAANIYMAGLTWSDIQIATSGAFQNSYAGNADGYLVKFDSSGDRIWASYYGGSEEDWAEAVTCDTSGNIYIAGTTGSTSSISTPGSYQPVYGGGEWDGFLAKFNPLGARQWCTYYGGTGSDMPNGASCDNLGHVYVAGFTTSSTNISTPGGYRPTPDGGYEVFLAQFSDAGTLVWGTYYGGPGNEFEGVCAASGTNVYLAAWTGSTSGITSPGCWQPTFGGGGSDAFVASFNYLGSRNWATYYGGEWGEATGGITCDPDGNIYLLGSTGSSTGIASPGCYQPTYAGGGTDAFLVKFSSETGNRLWGTYYGGEGAENTSNSRPVADDSDNIYITGYTPSLTGIATPGAIQDSFAGGDYDGFMAKFNTNGTLQWGTYYGGSGDDEGMACASDGANVYLAGESNSITNIATPGGFEPTGGGGEYYYEGFLVKILPQGEGPLSAPATTENQSALSIFPSPNNGAFTLAGTIISANAQAQVSITDATGKTITETEAAITNNYLHTQINLGGNIPAGAYFLKVITSARVYVLPFEKI